MESGMSRSEEFFNKGQSNGKNAWRGQNNSNGKQAGSNQISPTRDLGIVQKKGSAPVFDHRDIDNIKQNHKDIEEFRKQMSEMEKAFSEKFAAMEKNCNAKIAEAEKSCDNKLGEFEAQMKGQNVCIDAQKVYISFLEKGQKEQAEETKNLKEVVKGQAETITKLSAAIEKFEDSQLIRDCFAPKEDFVSRARKSSQHNPAEQCATSSNTIGQELRVEWQFKKNCLSTSEHQSPALQNQTSPSSELTRSR
jgi:hypothetical protein